VTISIPAISSGIYGFPKDKCAKIFFDVAIDHLENKETTLKEIRFVNFDDNTVKFFKKEFNSRFGGEDSPDENSDEEEKVSKLFNNDDNKKRKKR